MATIEADRKDIALYEVVNFLAGVEPECVFTQTSIDEAGRKEIGFPLDKQAVEAWGRGLERAIEAANLAKLKMKGKRAGSGHLEEVPPGEFTDIVVCNPFKELDIGAEFSGKTILENTEMGFALVETKRDFCSRPAVLWTHLCAASGAEVLRLARSLATEKPPSPDLKKLFQEAIDRKGATLSQREAETIASNHGAKENQKKVRDILESVQGKQKQGPRGPRTKPS